MYKTILNYKGKFKLRVKRIDIQVTKIKVLLILMNMLRYRHSYMPRNAVIKLQITHLLLLLYSQISVI